MPGPLPKKEARRRNAPTIPTTKLPAGGFKGRKPRPPKGYDLGLAGAAWWKWAWSLPQAAAWDTGALYFLARRAQLEDDLATLARLDAELPLADLLGLDDEDEVAQRVARVISGLKRLAGGSTSLMKEMRELDNRLGLNPKALAELRWTTVPEGGEKKETPKDLPANVRRLPAVDPAAAAI